jgi:hypothetical protein
MIVMLRSEQPGRLSVVSLPCPFLISEAQRRANVAREELRLLPGGEVVAAVEFVGEDELGVRTFSSASRRSIELVREHAHGNRNGGALDVEEVQGVLPIDPTRRHPSVRQPRDREVVDDLVSCEAPDGIACDCPRDV